MHGDFVAWPSPSIIVININSINYNILFDKLTAIISQFFVTEGWHLWLSLALIFVASKLDRK